MNRVKFVLTSWTLWANVLAALALFLAKQFHIVITDDMQKEILYWAAQIMTWVNAGLRFKTKAAVTINPSKATE